MFFCTTNIVLTFINFVLDPLLTHSLRHQGILADQEVIFGAPGETLRLKHTTLDRQCFMPGVLLACKKVVELDQLVYGLEELL